jgi:hypothetical protein
MPHARSSVAVQRRIAARIVGAAAHFDRETKERVNTLSQGELIVAVVKQVGDCAVVTFSKYERGEVLTNGQGTGTQQYPDRVEAVQALEGKGGWDRSG